LKEKGVAVPGSILSRRFLRLIKRPPQLLYAIGLGPLYGRSVLLLTTTGRRTGLPRVTPLQYEEIDGAIYLGSARGVNADWFRNIQADPRVEVRIGKRRLAGIAEPITDPVRVADFLEYRLNHHPRMVGAIMRMEGLPANHDRSDIEEYARRRALVVVRPSTEGGE
jgi:deazaflavin-dependent oxidoreductase (nitroreductase family)